MNKDFLRWGLWYREVMGFSIIPIIPQEKKPQVKWEEYQKRKADKEEIATWWNKTPEANVAIVTGEISGITVIDEDTEEGRKNLEKIFPETFITPMVKTPRGGRHYYCRYTKGLTNKAGVIPGTDFRGEGGYVLAPPSVNGNNIPYQWIRELSLTDIEIQPLPDLYLDIILKGLLERGGTSTRGDVDTLSTPVHNVYKILQEGTRDNDLFKIGMALADGHCPAWMIEQVLEILALSSNPSYPLKDIPVKIKSILGRLKRKERNLAEEVREFFCLQSGHILSTDVQKCLQVSTREERKNISMILSRLEKEGIIEKYGERRGCYRPVERSETRTKFIKERIVDFPIHLPFGLDHLCKLYPKSIIVIAGTKGSGKTALALKIILDNQETMPCIYLHSEGGDEEFSERMQNFGITDESQIKFTPIRCFQNFQDYITPDRKIFIIDYLEIHQNFYEVAIPLKKIHDKLQDGIAIVCLQKKRGAMFGRGDEFSQEVARLYLSMDYLPAEQCTKLMIVNAKAPRGDENLTGWSKKIKITRKGTRLTQLDEEWNKLSEIDLPLRRKGKPHWQD